MKLLIIPTEFEFKKIFPHLETPKDSIITLSPSVSCLICGIGSTYALLGLSKFSTNNPTMLKSISRVLLVGIAGLNTQNTHGIQMGEVVQVTSESDGNTGAQAESFLSAQELGWTGDWKFNLKELPVFEEFKKVSSLSVQACSGTPQLAQGRKKQFDCDIENMEGHAVGLWAKSNHLEFSEIRAISNWVGDRNHKNWKFSEALENLLNPIEQWINESE